MAPKNKTPINVILVQQQEEEHHKKKKKASMYAAFFQIDGSLDNNYNMIMISDDEKLLWSTLLV